MSTDNKDPLEDFEKSELISEIHRLRVVNRGLHAEATRALESVDAKVAKRTKAFGEFNLKLDSIFLDIQVELLAGLFTEDEIYGDLSVEEITDRINEVTDEKIRKRAAIAISFRDLLYSGYVIGD